MISTDGGKQEEDGITHPCQEMTNTFPRAAFLRCGSCVSPSSPHPSNLSKTPCFESSAG